MAIPGHSPYYALKDGTGTYIGYRSFDGKIFTTSDVSEAYTTKNIDRLKRLMDMNQLSGYMIREVEG